MHGGRADVEEELAAHEIAAAKRRRHDSELKDQAQKATGLATATYRGADDSNKGLLRLVERKATDAGFRGKEGAITCPSCGQLAARGSLSCAQCTEIFSDRETIAAARAVLSEEMRTALRMVIKWIDRGVSSEAGTFRASYKKYRDRAVIKGIPDKDNVGAQLFFNSVAERFHDDMDFRKDMEDQGWSSETICLIEAIALMPALENPGRTRDERAVYEDHYNVYTQGGPVQADPTRFVHPQNYVAGERRREDHERWATNSRHQDKGKQESKRKSKGIKGKFAQPLQAIRESKGRGKGQTKSDLLNRMYQFATENPASAIAGFVAHLPPRNIFTEAASVSSPEGEPSQAGWDIFAIAVFMSSSCSAWLLASFAA